MIPPSANLIPLDSHEIIENRRRKLVKLEILREKSMVDRKDEPNPHELSSGNEDLLPYLDDSNFSDAEFSKLDDDASVILS